MSSSCRAHHNDIGKADEMCADLRIGDIAVMDRGYYSYGFYRGLDERGITFVGRERHRFKYKVVATVPKDRLPVGIVSDERVILANRFTKLKYTSSVRRVKAIVEIDRQKREMVFVTNNCTWSARTIADLYKSRWTIELLFKELKQTLQLQSFYGTNENAVKWQNRTGAHADKSAHATESASA